MGSRVYVGRLSYDCRERDLEKFFHGYGKIREILIKNGFAFVDFYDYKDADDAVFELNGKSLLGERVILEIARGPMRRPGGGGGNRFGFRRRGSWLDKYGPPTRTEYRLIVENLSSKVSWQDLKDFMRQAGEVTYADAHKQRRNEGIVEFASYSDMKSAYKQLNNTELNGRRIKLIEDRPHGRSRSRSSSRSRSKSRSRSRSRSRRHSRGKSYSKSRSRSRSASRSRSKSRERSPSRSPARYSNEEKSRSRSKSKSKSPAKSNKSDLSDREYHSASKSPITEIKDDDEEEE